MEIIKEKKFYYKNKNPYIPVPVKIKRIKIESEDRMLKSFDVEFLNEKDKKDFEFMPGQFVELSVLGKGEAPFGIASSPTEKEFIRFTVNRAGVVTTALHEMDEGEIIGMRGPLGNWYPVEKFEKHNVILIGGGFAFTTLRSLFIYMLEQRDNFKDITVIYGVRTPGMFLYKEELTEWKKRKDVNVYLTVDKEFPDWDGYVGFVPQVTEKISPSPLDAYVVMCGPPLMIKFTIPVLMKLGFKPEQVYTSLERRMKCGIGKCGRCNIGPYYVCKDGPVFSLSQLEGLPHEY